MIPSYSNLKNHLETLKKHLSKMGIPQKLNLHRMALQESSLKQQNPTIFLELLHSVICDYSASFNRWVVEEGGSLEFNNDKKFIEIVLTLARRKLGMQVGITVDQFLTPNKFLLQKIEFVGNFSKIVFEWDLNKKKSSVKEPIQIKKQSQEQEDDDFEYPREINVKPTKEKINVESSKRAGQQRLNKYFKDHEDTQDKSVNQPKPIKTSIKNQKPNVFPKNFKQSESQEEQIQTKPTHKAFNKTVQYPNPVSPASADPVTREEFNEMLEMLSTVNNAVTSMADKFNKFQANVIGWMNNMNAKVGIMEENIKMIKTNL